MVVFNFWSVLIIVLVIFIMIFAVSVPSQMRKQKQANDDARQAYRDGWQRALDVHGIPDTSEAENRSSAWIAEHGQHGSWVSGAKAMKLAPVWEEGYRSALRAHGVALSESDLAHVEENPYAGR